MDNESLPTGMDKDKVGQISFAKALTASNSAASCPDSPQAAIQFAESLTVSRSPISAAHKFVMASPTAMREAAAELITAIGVRSPMAMAWPPTPW